MKERQKYHIWDIVNISIFYTIFILFFSFCIIGVVDFVNGNLPVERMIYRFALTILMCVPYAIKKIFKISFSKLVSSIYYLYMFLAGFLGVVINLYAKLVWWDILIHFLMGAVIAVLSIYILNYTIYRKDKSKHNLFFTFLFMIMFSMGVGALWEIVEFFGDLLFGLNLQRFVGYVGAKAVFDTMLDLCIDLIGAICGVLFTVVAIKIDKKFLKTFYIKKLKNKEQEIESIEE